MIAHIRGEVCGSGPDDSEDSSSLAEPLNVVAPNVPINTDHNEKRLALKNRLYQRPALVESGATWHRAFPCVRLHHHEGKAAACLDLRNELRASVKKKDRRQANGKYHALMGAGRSDRMK